MGLFYTKICTMNVDVCSYMGDNRKCNCCSCMYSAKVHRSDLRFCAELLEKQMLMSKQLETQNKGR